MPHLILMAINKVCGTVLLKAINMVCGTVLSSTFGQKRT